MTTMYVLIVDSLEIKAKTYNELAKEFGVRTMKDVNKIRYAKITVPKGKLEHCLKNVRASELLDWWDSKKVSDSIE